MYVCMYVCMCIYIYVCTYACIYVYKYIYVHTYEYVYLWVYICRNTEVCSTVQVASRDLESYKEERHSDFRGRPRETKHPEQHAPTSEGGGSNKKTPNVPDGKPRHHGLSRRPRNSRTRQMSRSPEARHSGHSSRRPAETGPSCPFTLYRP